MEASLPDMYELLAPESISARHVIPFTLTTTTGKIPSAVLPLAVNTFRSAVALSSRSLALHILVWWRLLHFRHVDLLKQAFARCCPAAQLKQSFFFAKIPLRSLTLVTTSHSPRLLLAFAVDTYPCGFCLIDFTRLPKFP